MAKIHDNPTRDEWTKKIAALKSLGAGAALLTEFRAKYMSPFKTDFSLELDGLWIECKIEEKVALLKHAEFNDTRFLNSTTSGMDAQKVANEVVAKMDACTDMYEAERIHINFRLANKPPIMPVNVFMDTDRLLGTKLMELRNTDYYALPLEELRKVRGAKVIVLQ
ncbi:aromatic/alkene monooxygenase hydroxylase subunit gamma [Crenothrix polyspora]|uniref:Methane monooxygenase component A gamma chain n=1 Tax=Crenothrix polyspora TaxID=360316 RepID=A0A1R4H9U5_9GAMM|nr:methane monooxygenase [Crenothrix polyspora]SJM93032.1 Methane monooxygenase component A gamma chain [Crenothrix polyspora]